jgi:hypothetical protein
MPCPEHSLPQPAPPRDFAPAVLAEIARMLARSRHSVRPERAWAPWAIGIGALVAMVFSVGFSPSGMGRVSGLALLRLPWTVQAGLTLAVGLYLLGLVASLHRRVRES